MQQYSNHSTVFFPFEHDKGCPAVIEIFGNREERIHLTSLYINDAGEAHADAASEGSIPADAAESLSALDQISSPFIMPDKNIIPVRNK